MYNKTKVMLINKAKKLHYKAKDKRREAERLDEK